jgi:hypothetical protein
MKSPDRAGCRILLDRQRELLYHMTSLCIVKKLHVELYQGIIYIIFLSKLKEFYLS